ncbi:MAG TPA: type VI secretion system tip protein TssI/VgrG, partial [Polyangiaceae bacterium]|nr:type VI secretion system tip protein TssI/VgrG [Polyangiaceae bacterium]
VMYGETELDFVHRLLEDEGIFYSFKEILDDEESSKEAAEDAQLANAIILGDGTYAYEPIDGDTDLELKSPGGLSRPSESLFDLRRSAKMRPGSVALRDWNLEKPLLPMDVAADLKRFDDDSVHGPEFYDYPGKYELPSEGQRKARLMAEAFTCQSHVTRMRSDTARLVIARTFKLVPDAGFLAQGISEEELVVTRLEHDYTRDGEGGAKLVVGVDTLPAETVYRPERKTPSPVITNPLTGIVTGPKGEDIHTDSLGRVKVQFHWDRYQMPDDNVSHWVPVLQDNTGTSAAIPRIGWEVVVAFVDGDPDRPYVLGRVYNAKDVFPESLPANKTKTALRSLSSPTRDGHNEIWIEDKAGQELMSMQAEKDQNVVVANNKTEKVGNFEENNIVKDETFRIGANNTVTVKGKQVLTVDGNQSISVGGSRTRKVGKTEQDTVAGARSLSVGASHFRRIGGFDNAGLKKSLGETTGGVEIEASLKQNTTNTELLQTLTVGGAVVEVAGQGKEEKSEMMRVETIGAMLSTIAKSIEIKAKEKRSTSVLANLVATAKETIKLAAEGKLDGAITNGKLNGTSDLTIVVGKSKVVLNAKAISIESKEVVLQGKGATELMPGKAAFK